MSGKKALGKVKILKCDQCDYTSTDVSNLEEHKFEHIDEKPEEENLDKPHKCDQCKYATKVAASLKRHKLIHTGEKPHKCDQCAYRGRRPTDLKYHKIRAHDPERRMKCSTCDFTCARFEVLDIHQRRHAGIKPYECDYCDFTAVSNGDVKRHMSIIHEKRKPYKCTQCNYCGSNIGNLKSHIAHRH